MSIPFGDPLRPVPTRGTGPADRLTLIRADSEPISADPESVNVRFEDEGNGTRCVSCKFSTDDDDDRDYETAFQDLREVVATGEGVRCSGVVAGLRFTNLSSYTRVRIVVVPEVLADGDGGTRL